MEFTIPKYGYTNRCFASEDLTEKSNLNVSSPEISKRLTFHRQQFKGEEVEY
jgi:hypothetical protein